MKPEQSAYIEKMEAKIDQAKHQAAQYGAQIKEMSADIRIEAERQLRVMHERLKDAEGTLDHLRTQADEAFDGTRQRLQMAWDEVAQYANQLKEEVTRS